MATSPQARVCGVPSVSFQMFDENGNIMSKKIVFGPNEKYIRNLKTPIGSDYPYYLLISTRKAKQMTIKVLDYDGKID